MRNTKSRILAMLLSLCLVFTLLPMAALAEYTDTEDIGEETKGAIDRWTEEGVVSGNPDGTFAPTGHLKRSEFAKTLTTLMNITEKADISAYTDVPADAWYVDVLKGVVARGIMNGTSPTTLSPESNMTREQMFVMIGRALGIEPAETCKEEIPDADTAGDWAIGYINALVNMGVIKGVDAAGDVAPLNEIERGATMVVLDRLIGGYANKDGETATIVEGRITLIVADNVKVEGKANGQPIVVAGTANKVDMADVEGEAVVQVNVSDVVIENAPVGTEIKAAADVENVMVGDVDVTAEPDKDVVVTEPEPENPTPVTPPPSTPTTDSVTATDIDAIIE